MSKAKEAAEEARRKLALRKAEMEAQISEEINKRRTELTSLQEVLSAGGDRVTRTELRSPVRGTVKRVVVNTLGGVVRPGDPVMEVVSGRHAAGGGAHPSGGYCLYPCRSESHGQNFGL